MAAVIHHATTSRPTIILWRRNGWTGNKRRYRQRMEILVVAVTDIDIGVAMKIICSHTVSYVYRYYLSQWVKIPRALFPIEALECAAMHNC